MLQEIESYQGLAEPFLREICDACHASSTWLLKHDFNKRIATVVAEFISEHANSGEKKGDIGAQYPEGLESHVWDWLHSPQPQFVNFHVDDIPNDRLEYLIYIEDDVKSIVWFAVYDGSHVWGYISVWDTRQKHDFSTAEIAAAIAIVRRLEAALKNTKKP